MFCTLAVYFFLWCVNEKNNLDKRRFNNKQLFMRINWKVISTEFFPAWTVHGYVTGNSGWLQHFCGHKHIKLNIYKASFVSFTMARNKIDNNLILKLASYLCKLFSLSIICKYHNNYLQIQNWEQAVTYTKKSMIISTKKDKRPCNIHSPFMVIPYTTLVGDNNDGIINTWNWIFTRLVWYPSQWLAMQLIKSDFQSLPLTFVWVWSYLDLNLWYESQSIQLTEKWLKQ